MTPDTSTSNTSTSIKVSVIIACLNEAEHIAQQLEALSRQCWSSQQGSWEVIVADNGSTDGTPDIARRFADRFNLTVLDAANQPGPSYARNLATHIAKGDILLFTDADDVVADDWLANMTKALIEHDFVAARLEFHKLNPGWIYHSRGRPQEQQLANYGNFLPYAFGTSLGVKKHLHNQCNGFDTDFMYSEDMEYCWRLQECGATLVYVSEAVVHYRFRSEHRAIYRQARRYAKSNVRLYRTYLERHRTNHTLRLPPKPKLNFKTLAYLLLHYARLRDDADRGAWAWHLGWQLGILAGAWRYRVLPF
jgi:glycosyltransferase involved in cell wall biosynthesis